MKIYKKIYKNQIKILGFITFLLAIPIFLNTPIISNFESNQAQEKIEVPKTNLAPNAHYFSSYKAIIIDHDKVAGSTSLINFPFLLSILDTDLHDDVQPDGDDIAFSMEDTWLDHEIEVFDQSYSSTHAQLIAWIRIPVLYATVDTVIRMYYGNSTMKSQQNPSGVWVNYAAVYHMNQDPSSSLILDSTSNNYDLTPGPGFGSEDLVDGTFGKAIDVDRTGGTTTQYFELSSGFSNPTNELSIEFWFKPRNFLSYQRYFNSHLSSRCPQVRYYAPGLGNMSVGHQTENGQDNTYTNNPSWSNRWYYFVTNWQGGTIGDMHTFIDGSLDSQKSGDYQLRGTALTWTAFTIGSDYDQTDGIDAILEEFRIYNSLHSAGWIATEYENQYDPSSFYSIGSERLTVWEPPNAYYFTYYKTITIDHTKISGTGIHVDFPMLVSIIDEDLRYHTQPDGDDIAFSAEGGWLDHEIEFYNQSYSDTHAHLMVWIQIPFLSTSQNTTITMYYGNSTMSSRENPAGTWANTYKGVWHLNELSGGANAIKDSSLYSNDGTDYSNPIFGSDGKIINSVGFNDASNQRIEVSDDNSLDISNQLTIEAWINPNVNNKWMTIVSKMDGTWGSGSISNFDIYFAINSNGNLDIGLANPSNQPHEWSSSVPVSAGIWQHIVFTYHSSTSTGTIYKNGVSSTHNFGIGSLGTNSRPFYIGFNRGWTGEVFDGYIDEVRVSNTVRSSDWITTEYENQIDPNSFYNVGKEQLVRETPPNADHFDYFKIFTIDHLNVEGVGSHMNFPLLISALDEDLHFDVQSDGDDIAFAMDGKWLDHQIELFNKSYSGTQAQLIAWVRIPFLSTAFDSNVTMYYGNSSLTSQQNPTRVWYSDYAGVWHLTEDPSGPFPQMKDSTSPASDGSTYGTMTSSDQITGMIDGALNLDGNNDYIDFGNPAELQFTGELTVQAWFKAENFIDNDYLVVKHGGTGYRGWDISFDYDSIQAPNGWIMFRYSPDGTNILSTGRELVKPGQWYQVAGIFKPNEYAKLIFNGTEVAIDTVGIPPSLNDPPLPLRVGRRSDGSTSWFDGIVDEVRVSNVARSSEWMATEYKNQFNPSTFYSIGDEERLKPLVFVDAQINAIDTFGNLLPNVTISLYQNTQLIERDITSSIGNIQLNDLIAGEYNFTATINSNVGALTEIVNTTSDTILIDQAFQIIDIICNVGTNFFELIDADGNPVESGWVLVGNSSHIVQKCPIDDTGHARFWWLNTIPYQYNYTVCYQNSQYNPSIIQVASGNINTPNTTIQESVALTTIEFTILTISVPITPVSGAKLKFHLGDPFGISIANLTTDLNGKVTLRWLTSTVLGGDYSLQIEFFGVNRFFNETVGGPPTRTNISFTVNNKDSYEFRILVDLGAFQTELISLNPTDYIIEEWGTVVMLRLLFNISRVESGYEYLLGPTNADLMRYQLFLGGQLVGSGNFLEEEGIVGRHFTFIDTTNLDSGESYVVIISAHKSGFTIPSDLILQLNILENELELNQSENDDSTLSTYWGENVNMTLASYGTNSESLTLQSTIFQSSSHEFSFLIPDSENQWNLSKIVFNFHNIIWNVFNVSNINFSIADEFGHFSYFFDINTPGWDYTQGSWTGITLDLNMASPTNDNKFGFIISGSFDNTIDVIADAYFIRDGVNVQYSKFNITNAISILTQSEGWAIKNITFEISDCYNTSSWNSIDLTTLTRLNITTNEGFKYSLDEGFIDGTGRLTIDDRIIYPIGNQFFFTIESEPDVIFNAILKVEYIQEFYRNGYLETYNLTKTSSINNGSLFRINAVEDSWNEKDAKLWINGINDGFSYYLPSDLTMNITIGGQTYDIIDYSQGIGIFSLSGFNKNEFYNAVINTKAKDTIDFTLILSIEYSRKISYEVIGPLSYFFREDPSVLGNVQYFEGLGCYLLEIDTSVVDVDEYTVRFTITLDHYTSIIKDLKLLVQNRLALINGSYDYFRSIETIYVEEPVNFTFFYTDMLTGSKITNLDRQDYIWERYDNLGNVLESGSGVISTGIAGSYILDFDTVTRAVGEYLLIITLDKDNYEYKNAMILLTINKRILDYNLSNNFVNYRTNIEQGKNVIIEITLTDPTRQDIYLVNATITLTMGGNVSYFEYVGNGTYRYIFSTSGVNAFFTSQTFSGIINISRANYISQEFTIVIVVEMSTFLGIPLFYLILILSSVAVIAAAIVGYRIYRNAKIPTFIKKVRSMKKSIKSGNEISESLLYRNKEVFVGEKVKSNWDKIGLSLEDIFGIELTKKAVKAEKTISVAVKRRDLKPLGMVLMKWDERIGTEILAKYPAEITVSEKTMMQIYSTHEYSGEKGIITLSAGSMNIISYYTGPETGYYLLLILSLDDDPDVYEAAMADVLRVLLDNIDDDVYIQLIPSLFQRLSVYPSLSDEEILILNYQDEIKQMIIDNLRDTGVTTKSELTIWLKDKYVEGFFDLDSSLIELFKKDIVKQVSVKGLPSSLIVLTTDIFMLRVPPIDLFKDPSGRGIPTQFVKEYKDDVKKYFQTYRPTAEDNVKIIETLANPEAFETFRLLRSAIVTRQDLEKLRVKGVSDIYGVLKLLWDCQMIKVFRDENNNEYYALLTEFYIDLLFPKYILRIIKMAYEQKTMPDKALIEYLNVLENAYYNLKKQSKLTE